jgi:hypothetical protein
MKEASYLRSEKLINEIKKHCRYYKEETLYGTITHYEIVGGGYFIPEGIIRKEYWDHFSNLSCSIDELYDKYSKHWLDKLDEDLEEDLDSYNDYSLPEHVYKAKTKFISFMKKDGFIGDNEELIRKYSSFISESELDSIDKTLGNGINLGKSLYLLNRCIEIFSKAYDEGTANAIFYNENTRTSFPVKQVHLNDEYFFPIIMKDDLLYAVETKYILNEFKSYINNELTFINEKLSSYIKLYHLPRNIKARYILEGILYRIDNASVLNGITFIWEDFAQSILEDIESELVKFIIVPNREGQ